MAETTYLVLRQIDTSQKKRRWEECGEYTVNSGQDEAAIRSAMLSSEERASAAGVYVAVPIRNFDPQPFYTEATVHVKKGEKPPDDENGDE